jgi:hypothetical protein
LARSRSCWRRPTGACAAHILVVELESQCSAGGRQLDGQTFDVVLIDEVCPPRPLLQTWPDSTQAAQALEAVRYDQLAISL